MFPVVEKTLKAKNFYQLSRKLCFSSGHPFSDALMFSPFPYIPPPKNHLFFYLFIYPELALSNKSTRLKIPVLTHQAKSTR